MKTILRFMAIGGITVTVLAFGALNLYAQDACADVNGANEKFTKFRTLFAQKGMDARKSMIETAKEFLATYGACEAFAEQNKYLKDNMAGWEAAYAKVTADEAKRKLYLRFDEGVQAKNWDEVYSAGKEIVSKEPERTLDQMITLGSIGLYESYSKNNKFNEDTIRFAKMSLERMKAGAVSTNGKYGIYQFGVGSKENALSEMNFVVAHLTFHEKGDKKGALPYYYAVAQNPGKYKDDFRVYQSIGAYYFAEFQNVTKEYAAIAATQKPEDSPEVRAQQDAQLKEKTGMVNAYLERALDAFGRAHKLMKEPAAKAELSKNLQELYKLRFQKTDGMDTYLAAATAKPLPDPTAPVTPVIDQEPTTAAPAATNIPRPN